MKTRQKEPLKTDIFQLQRDNIQLILEANREQLVAKQKLAVVANYFILKWVDDLDMIN